MLVNTAYFSDAAKDYKKNKGIYIKAPEGSREFNEYWKEQKRRCLEGYSVGDVRITGRNYFYLNFYQINKVIDALEKSKNKVSSIVAKRPDFPDFMEVQYNWWWAKEIAWNGITPEEYNKLNLRCFKLSPENMTGGKHITCGKTRGCGFSYMEAADGVYNYNFIPGSKSFYFASNERYLIGDGILTKAWDGLEFLNTQTQRFFKKNRQVKNQDLHKRASYKDNQGDERGYKSEIIGITVDDPNKVRGGRGIKLSFEEAGSFKRLKASLEIARPLVEESGFVTGQISVFGTGGEEGESIEGLEAFFYNPWEFNMMQFDNIWDGEELEGGTCGFFVPASMASMGFFDEEGVALVNEAKAHWDKQRAIKSKSKDPKGYDRLVAERPEKPSELFNRINSNVFNIGEIKKQISRIKADKDIQGLIQHGLLSYGKNGVEFDPTADVRILPFPHNQAGNLNGGVTEIDKPFKDKLGVIPDDLYFISVDPFYKDDAEDKTSLGSIRVWMRASPITGYNSDRMVSWYAGRPSLEEFHRIIFMMSQRWNAKVQSEISGGGQGIIDYARNKKLLHLCEYEPEMLHNKEIASNSKNKAYFMNMNNDRKKLGIIYFANWTMEEIATTESGEKIYNINRIYDLALLEEMRRFNDKGNFDRISDCILGMFMFKEKAAIEIASAEQTSSIFNRTFFTDHIGSLTNNFEALGLRAGIDY